MLNKFVNWYHEYFRNSLLYRNMESTVEGSPWHRERNVGVHTDMVVAQYLAQVPVDAWTIETLCGALACTFHDVGKPSAEEVRFKPERGEYRAYSGHEVVSARMWEEFAVTQWHVLKELSGLEFTPFHIYSVAWMIEHHLPYGVKKADKLDRFHRTAQVVSGGGSAFTDVLTADGFGRISDDADTKRQNVLEFCDEFLPHQQSKPDWIQLPLWQQMDKVCVLPIGASGSGKSTWTVDFAELQSNIVVSHSWDELRLEWYDPDDYSHAFEMQCADKDFGKKANARFMEELDQFNVVVVDNTNTSKKRRAFHVNSARQKGFFLLAVLFPVSYMQLGERQGGRTDKSVPPNAVFRQHGSVQMPFYGEFDQILVHDGNLPK